MVCKKCGNEVDIGEVFCQKCGTAIQIVPDYNPLDSEIEVPLEEKNKEKASSAYEDNDLVFCTQLGRPLDPTNMRRTCYSICAKIGVSNFHPHCLRHTFTTRGAENNVDVRVMQKFLGHATIKETADTYTHVLDDLKQDEIRKLDSAVNY